MTNSELQLALNTMGQWMKNGELDKLADVFETPMPLYAKDRFVLQGNKAAIQSGLSAYRRAAEANGVAYFRPTIQQVEARKHSRMLAVVRWDHLRADGTLFSSSEVRYVFRRDQTSVWLRIELVEYIQMSFEKLCDELYPLDQAI